MTTTKQALIQAELDKAAKKINAETERIIKRAQAQRDRALEREKHRIESQSEELEKQATASSDLTDLAKKHGFDSVVKFLNFTCRASGFRVMAGAPAAPRAPREEGESKRTIVNDALCAKVKSLHDAGKGTIAIRKELQISTPTIYKIYGKLGIEKRPLRRVSKPKATPSGAVSTPATEQPPVFG